MALNAEHRQVCFSEYRHQSFVELFRSPKFQTESRTKPIPRFLGDLNRTESQKSILRTPSLWHMPSAVPDLQLPSQLESIAAMCLVQNNTAWWQRHVFEELGWNCYMVVDGRVWNCEYIRMYAIVLLLLKLMWYKVVLLWNSGRRKLMVLKSRHLNKEDTLVCSR